MTATVGLTGSTYTPPANAVVIAAGANIQSAVNSHPAGTAFILSAGTYTGQTIHPLNGDSFYGTPGQTILNGNGAAQAFQGQVISNVTISGLTITNYAPASNGVGTLGTDASATGWVVQGCTFTNISNGVPIMLGNSMVIQNCSIHNNQNAGIESWNVTGAIIRNNAIYANNQSLQDPFTAVSNNAGIKICQSTNTQILNNDVSNNLRCTGIWTDISCKGTVIDGNNISGNGAGGIFDELDYGTTISNNTISYNNPTAIDGFRGGGIYIQNSQNANIYGNTLTGNVGGIWAYQDNRGSGPLGPWVVANNSVHNNIIQMSAGQNGYGGTATTGLINYANNAYNMSGTAQLVISGNTVSWPQWEAAGNDTASSGSTFNTATTIPKAPDTLTLRMSEDYYQGDAQFVVKVNGTQVGGTMTTHALHSTGDSDVFQLTGNWGTGVQQVQIQFINDAYGGSASTDRNLYVSSVAYDGKTDAKTSATLLGNSTSTFAVGGATATAADPADNVTLSLSEDAYQGDARFVVTLDGKTITTAQSVTTLHSSGGWQAFQLAGNFGTGPHTLGVKFTNDAYGGSSSLDRNLYSNGISVNGQHYGSGSTELYSTGSTVSYAFTTAH
jgi:parallel beta-helix repeat protein